MRNGMRWLIPALMALLSACALVQGQATYIPNPGDSERLEVAEHGESAFDPEQLARQVVIRRTDHGVPHIEADNFRAAGYALGYLQLEDYGEEVVETMIKARGEWAKHQEPKISEFESVIDDDAMARRQHERARQTWDQLDPEARDMMEGFAVGVNRYIELHPDEFDDWVNPDISRYDVHARSIGSPSQGSIRTFLEHLEQVEEDDEPNAIAGTHGEDPRSSTIWARRAFDSEEQHPDAGSNAWALGPERTESGNAILLRNPHLSWDAGYYEAHLKVPGEINFYGDFRIGRALGIIGGFNEHLGWATTNNAARDDAIYAFRADPDHPDHFLLNGESVPIEKQTVEVEFRHGEATGVETREFLQTPYGPVIHRGGGYVYVIKSANDGEYRSGEQFFRMMQTSSLEEWREAMRIRGHPFSNLLYADADGNAYYVWNGSEPDMPHKGGRDSSAVLVETEQDMWQELLDFDQLPQFHNPEGGYLRNENDTFHFTNLNQVLEPGGHPSHFPEPELRLRSQHSLELLHNDRVFSLEDVVKKKHSMRMILADRVKPDLVTAVQATGPQGEVAEAIELIEDWDNTVARDSRGGLLFKIWWEGYRDRADTGDESHDMPEAAGFSEHADSLFTRPWSPDEPIDTPEGLADPRAAVEAFEWAVEEAEERHGEWDLAWGDVHRARIGDKDLPVGGCTGLLGCFRVLWFVDHEEDEQKLEVRGGDGWVSAVEFADTPRAYTVLAYGQSIKEDSPHYNDQLEAFTGNEMTPVRFTEQQIRDHLINEYHPGLEANQYP